MYRFPLVNHGVDKAISAAFIERLNIDNGIMIAQAGRSGALRVHGNEGYLKLDGTRCCTKFLEPYKYCTFSLCSSIAPLLWSGTALVIDSN